MNKYNNPRLLNTVVSGTGMKHPMQPHVVVGDTANGFIRGDLMDANAIVELVNNIIGGAPDTLDTLKEAADRIAALEHDTQDYQVGDTLASKVWNTMRGLQAVVVGDEPAEEQAIVLNWNNTVFDPHDEGRYGSLEIGVATSQKPGLMSTADKAALGAASAAVAQIPQIKQTIEDNELTVAAALNDLNSRVTELEPDKRDRIYVMYFFNSGPTTNVVSRSSACLFGYIEDNVFHVYSWKEAESGDVYPIPLDVWGYVSGTGSMLSGKYMGGPKLNVEPGYIEYSVAPNINCFFGGTSYEVECIFPEKEDFPIGKHPAHFNEYITVWPQTIRSTITVEYQVENDNTLVNLLYKEKLANLNFKMTLDGEDITINDPGNPDNEQRYLNKGTHVAKYSYDASAVPERMFYYCDHISNVTFTGTTTGLGKQAFQNVPFTSIDLPQSVHGLNESCFQNCTNLEEITIRSKYICPFGTNLLMNTDSLESIYVPSELVESYKTAFGWQSYADKIKPIPEE